MGRLATKTETIRRLFALSGNVCAFPECSNKLISSKGKFIGQICHIEGANEGGERFNREQSDEDRRDFGNLLLLCYEHHIESNDVIEYPATRLQKIKQEHESKFLKVPYRLPEGMEDVIIEEFRQKLDAIYDISIDTNSKVNELLKQQGDIFEFIKSSAAQVNYNEEKIYIAHLDSIKQLKKHNKFQTVIELLTDYKDKNWDKLSPETKYKVLVNLGITYFDLQDNHNACKYFIALKDTGYKNNELNAFLALAYALSNDKEQFLEYFEKGKAENPENLNLWFAFLYIYQDEKPWNKLLDELPVSVLDKPEVLFNLGEVAYNQGHSEEGVFYLKSALALFTDQTDERIADTKAVVASKILLALVTPFKFVYTGFSPEEWGQIKEAKKFLDDAWDTFKDTELAQSRWYILMNRGIVYKLSGEPDKALFDLQRAYDISKNFTAFKNLTLHALQLGKLAMAEGLLDNAVPAMPLLSQQRFETDSIRARLLYLKGETEKSIEALLQWTVTGPSAQCFESLIILINTCSEKALLDQAIGYGQTIIDLFPENIQGYLVLGYLWQRKGEYAKASAYYLNAELFVTSETPPEILYQLGANLFDIKEYEKAVSYLDRVPQGNSVNEISKTFIYSCYLYGDLEKCLHHASRLFDRNPQHPFLAEIIISVYQEVGCYAQAIETVERFLPVAAPEVKDKFLFKAASLYYSVGDWAKVKELLSPIDSFELFSMEDCFFISTMLIKCRETKRGLSVAFQCRNRFYGSSLAHSAYLNIMTLADSDYSASMFPPNVTEDCAVVVNIGNSEELFVIAKDWPNNRSTLPPDSTLAIQLMGKKVSESFTIDMGFGISGKYFITSIFDKYVFAANESRKLFDLKFAGENGVVPFAGSEDQIVAQAEAFVKNISLKDNELEHTMYDLYNKRLITLGMIANTTGLNTAKLWCNLTHSNDIFLVCHSHNEMPDLEEAIDLQRPIVLDITGLLAIFFLSPDKNFLADIKNPLITPFSVISELKAFQQELAMFAADGRPSLSLREGGVSRDYIAPERINRDLNKIEAIVAWCKANTEIKFANTKIHLKREARNRADKMFGTSFHDAVLLAKEYHGIIFSDDDNFKTIVSAQYTLKSFSPYQLSIYLVEKNVLKLEGLEDFAFNLLSANHIYIIPTPSILWKAFEASQFRLSKPFKVAVKCLLFLRADICAGCVVQFCKKLYLDLNLPASREQIVLYILRELKGHRNFNELKIFMRIIIAKEFNLLQQYKDELISLINYF